MLVHQPRTNLVITIAMIVVHKFVWKTKINYMLKIVFVIITPSVFHQHLTKERGIDEY